MILFLPIVGVILCSTTIQNNGRCTFQYCHFCTQAAIKTNSGHNGDDTYIYIYTPVPGTKYVPSASVQKDNWTIITLAPFWQKMAGNRPVTPLAQYHRTTEPRLASMISPNSSFAPLLVPSFIPSFLSPRQPFQHTSLYDVLLYNSIPPET